MGPDIVRVLVVDDSAVCRGALRAALESDPEIEVVGEAADGAEALRLVSELSPSLVTMDLQMPQMGGLETIQRIMRQQPTPILVVTDRPKVDGVDMTFASLSRGALDLLPKAGFLRVGSPEAEAIARRVKALAREATRVRAPAAPAVPAPRGREVSVVGMGASTGGPQALATVFRSLPPDFPLPIVVVQHMDPLFEAGFVHWLARQCVLPVRMAKDGDVALPGTLFIAPQGQDLLVEPGGRIRLCAPQPGALHVPSVNRLFGSLATAYGSTALGVVLSGMGKDGAAGLKLMRERGALTAVQDAASSAIWGMPAAALEVGAAEYVVPVGEMSAFLTDCVLRVSSSSHPPSTVEPVAAGSGASKVGIMQKQKILLVDDSPVILEAGKMALEDAGFEVNTLDNPLTLANVMWRTRPDLVLLDVNMPAVTGDVVAKIIGRHGVSSTIPVVLYSDVPSTDLQERAKRCGARGFIRKTGDDAQLVAAVRRFLSDVELRPAAV